jgi:hypothetical protein
MPPVTVEQVLRQTGFNDEEIQRLDQRIVSGVGNVLTAATAAQEAAELAQRSNREFYDQTISPALNSWDQERNELLSKAANAEATAEFYRLQNAQAREGGFVAKDAPNYSQARDNNGRYVAGSGGSPIFTGDMNEFAQRAGQAIATLSDLQWKHQSLFGSPMPVSPSELIKEADRAGVDPVSFADRKFGFGKREQELAAEKAKKHDDGIRQEVETKLRREYAEKVGGNPDVRQGVVSRISEVNRAVKEGARPDPLMMSDSARQQATRRSIHERISENREAS